MTMDKKKFERSVKLCQLVHERQIDSEIGYEIRKLCEEGLLIDFQDQNRNKKTAIHLAVEKCDVTCVKFLLQFRPSLEVKDEDGKTPIELAELKGFDDILSLLKESSFDVITESYVEVLEYESIARQKIEAIKLRSTFKVLKLINCPSINEVWMKLDGHDYATIFNESSHFFFIAIEMKEASLDNNPEFIKKVLNLRRPMIVQLSSPNSEIAKIYFKDEKKEFMEITEIPQISQEKFDEAVISEQSCNMKLLVAALRSNLFGHFTGNLLDTKLNTNENRNKAVNEFARSNALCHRFFKLFDENLPQIDTIVAALSFKGDESLSALLDLPFEPIVENLKLTEYQQDILRVVDPCDYNLLMLATEMNNLDAVKLLLRCGCDFNHSDCSDKCASDICWDVKAFDCLAELIEAGSPYPNDFPNDFSAENLSESTEAFKRINAVTKVINSFHANIEDGEIEEVKKFISNHPYIKHAYDTNNQCALTVALQSSQVDIYSLLLSEGFEAGVDDEYQGACLKSRFKNEIRDSHRKYFKEAFDEPHLKRLLKMFRLSFGSKDRAKCSTIIRKMFDELNEIEEIIPILKICSTSDTLRIVFDFNCDSVVDMDVTKESKSLGAVYPSDGFVYIAAKNYKTEFYQVIGHLIHEMTHFAMKLTYDSCKPYDVADLVQTNRFAMITTEAKRTCDENPSTDSIVTTVFSCYTESVWHAELIVRVPQLLAHYKMNFNALEVAERNTPELFHFFREKTLKDVAAKSKVLHRNCLINRINKQTGIARKIANFNVNFENVENVDLKPFIIITSNAPQLTLAMLHQVFSSDSHIFVTLEQLAIGNVSEKLAKINAKQSLTVLIVDCNGWAQKYSEILRNLPKKLKNTKNIAFVMSALEGSAAKDNISKVELKTFNHKWDELTESTKVNLLNKRVTFQGIEMTLNRLVEPSSESMNFFPLCDILSDEGFKIGKRLHEPPHSFYISRVLRKKGENDNAESDQQVESESDQQDLPNQIKSEVMIISDEAGSGKSVTLFEIAKSLHDEYPDRWILFVDLKRHIEAFKDINDYQNIETFHDFIVQHILKNETEFDQELFKEMFRYRRTFVLFDGFDEISPNFKDLLLHVLRLFKPGSGNQLRITTRPHLEADLERALGNFVFKLEEFSEESQRSFLVKYWKSVGFKSEEDVEVLTKRLLEKFSDISRSRFIGLPLLLQMSAEIFNDPTKGNSLDKLESLNVASIFNKFVAKYLARWKESGNEISLKENVEIDRDGGILEIHHSIAIKHKFGEKFAVLKFDESDAEKIARVGLIRFDETKKKFEFIHETFAEYFVADFIWFHLKKMNRNPSHDCRLAIEIFTEVLKGDNFDVIKTFLDQTLETSELNLSEASCQSLGKCFSEVVKSQRRFAILLESLANKYDNISFFLLSLVKYADKEVLLRMLSEDRFGRNDLQISTGNISLYILCTVAATLIGSGSAKQLLLVGENSYKILFSAVHNNKPGVLTALCEALNTVFTEAEIKIMFQHEFYWGSLISSAATRSSNEVFNELLSLLPNYLSVEELKKLLVGSNSDKHNCLHVAVAHCTEESVKRLIDFAKSIFDTKELKLFLRQYGLIGRNIFQLAALNRKEKIFQAIIESTCDVLSKDDLKSMLMEKGSEGSNVFHLITIYGNEKMFKELNSLLRGVFTRDEIKCMLMEKNWRGSNVLHMIVQLSNEVMLKELNSLLRGVFTRDEIKLMLMEKDSEGSNVLHIIVKHGDEIRLKELDALLRERLSDDEIRSLLLQVNEKGENCFRLAYGYKLKFQSFCKVIGNLLPIEDQMRLLKESSREIDIFQLVSGEYCGEDVPIDIIKHLLIKKDRWGRNAFQNAATFCTSENWNKLVAFAQTKFSVEEMKSFLIPFDSDRGGESCLHLAVANSHLEVCKEVVDTFKSVLSVEEQRKNVQQNYSDRKILFHHAAKSYNYFKIVIEYLSAILSRDQLGAMLRQKDSDERNVLFYFRYNEEVLNTLITFLTEILSKDEIKSLLLEKHCEGQNCFQYSVRFEYINNDVIRSFSNLIKSILNEDNQRKFFDNKNVFHLAAESQNPKIFSAVHKCLKDVFTDIEIKSMFQGKDSIGNNILHLICQNDNDKDLLVDFSKVLKDVLEVDELKDFLTSSNNHGSNCLLLAVKVTSKSFLNQLLSLIKRKLSIDDLQNMIQKRDFDGNNIFECASQNDDKEIFPFVRDFVKEILCGDQFAMLYEEFTICWRIERC